MNVPIVAELKILVGPEAGHIDKITAEKALRMWATQESANCDLVDARYPGGNDARNTAARNHWFGTDDAFRKLHRAAQSLNLSWRNAPPRSIDGNEITYRADGIKVGCQSLTLAQMKAMVAECEKGNAA